LRKLIVSREFVRKQNANKLYKMPRKLLNALNVRNELLLSKPLKRLLESNGSVRRPKLLQPEERLRELSANVSKLSAKLPMPRLNY